MTKDICLNKFKTGIIIRNGIEENGSWTKRLKHWRKSFSENSINTIIISAYPYKPKHFVNGSDGIFYLFNIRLPKVILYLLSPYILLFKLMKEKPQFVLIAHGGFFEFYTLPIYCKIAGIPLLVDIVDTIGRMYKKKKSLFDYIILYNKKLFDRFILRKAHEIFVISTNLKELYKKKFPLKKITLSVPTTVDIKEFYEMSLQSITFLNNDKYNVFNTSEYLKIFYAGTIARTNGIEFFLKIISDIIYENKIKVKIIFAIIIGNEKKLIQLAEKYKISFNIEIVPSVKQEYLPVLLCRTDVLFIPEQGNETADAGFPGKTAEYLMSGKPVITTSFSDLKNYLVNGKNAFISEIGDYNAYRNNLFSLLTNTELRNTIGASGRQLAIEKFSHQNCASPYISSICSYYSKK